MKVESTAEKPSSSASARPCCRAETMSCSEFMATRISPDDTMATSICALEPLIQVRQTFFQIERRRNAFQCQSQLHHRKSHFRLNANDDSFRTSQADHLRNLLECPRCVGVHYVHRRHIDNHPSRAKANDLSQQTAAELIQVCVGKSRLKGRNQKLPLFENHAAFFLLHLGRFRRRPPPCIPTASRPVRCHPAGHLRCSSCPGRRRL